MHRRRPRPRLILSVVAAVALALTTVAAPSATLAVSQQCTPQSAHWWAQAASGYPAKGNRLFTGTPLNWSVDYQSDSIMLETSFLVDNGNILTTIEGGYFSGYWYYTGSWYNGLLPYYALDGGHRAAGHTSTYLGGRVGNRHPGTSRRARIVYAPEDVPPLRPGQPPAAAAQPA